MKPFAWRRDGAVLLVAMLAHSVFTWLYFMTFAGRGTLTQSLYGGSKILLGLLPAWWFWMNRIQKREGAEDMPVRTGRSMMLGGVFGGMTVGGMLGLYHGFLRGGPALAGTAAAVQAKLVDAGVTGTQTFVLMAVFLSFVHAAFEEYYWRWFVFGRLRDGLPWQIAAIIAAVAFALHHVIVLAAYLPAEYAWLTAFLSLGIAVGGLVWSCIYQWTGSLAGAWLAHIGADLGIMWIGYDLCQGYLT